MRTLRGPAALLIGLLGGVVVLPARPASGPPATGTVEGLVRFTGKLPPPRQVLTADGPILHHDLVVDKKTKGLRDVVVSLLDAPAQPPVRGREPAYVDQHKFRFVPRVTAVQHGQKVRFDNNDPFNHSVRATSSVKANDFNVFVTQGRPIDCTFTPQKHPVAIGCSLHPGMSAWVFIFRHPWFAVSGERGTFRIANVLPGKHTLWFRHADSGLSARRTVAVRAGQAVRVEVEWSKTAD